MLDEQETKTGLCALFRLQEYHSVILYSGSVFFVRNVPPHASRERERERERDALTIVQSAVLRSHAVRLSVCDVGGSGSHRLEILETNSTDN